jgi:plasmid stabilization system protein ParE
LSEFSLTPRAVARLAGIFEWTIGRFGLPRAEAYRRDLLRRCTALASGSPPYGRPCGALLGEQANPADLYCYREGGHYIIYRKVEGRLIVIDFVHGARDLEGLLNDLTR